jgi:hypothetical protein
MYYYTVIHGACGALEIISHPIEKPPCPWPDRTTIIDEGMIKVFMETKNMYKQVTESVTASIAFAFFPIQNVWENLPHISAVRPATHK